MERVLRNVKWRNGNHPIQIHMPIEKEIVLKATTRESDATCRREKMASAQRK